jgi:SynChlorMet cassette radical SAM/SPASM protein ScmE
MTRTDIAAGEVIDKKESIPNIKIPRVPVSLFISITSRCNQACRHCSVYSDGFQYGPDLTKKEWLEFIDKIADLKVFRVKISGCEPFIREDIFEILDAIYSKPIRLSINTNATLISADGARRLSGYKDKLDDIMVSIDGEGPKSHDALRGAGAFEKTIKGIELLVKYVGNITAYCTVTRLNFRGLKEIIELVSKMGILSVKFNELLLEGRGLKFKNELTLNLKEKRETIDVLKELREKYPFISGTFFEMDEIFNNIRSGLSEGTDGFDPKRNYLSGCGALIQECAIRPDGWVTPCDRIPEICAGNILDTPLDIIWRESDTFTEFRKRFTTPITDLPTCRDCEYAFICTGGCAASAFYSSGTTLARDPSCCYKLFIEDSSDAAG